LSIVNETELCSKLHTITTAYSHIISLLTPENDDNYKPTEEKNPITTVPLIRKPSLKKTLYEIKSSEIMREGCKKSISKSNIYHDKKRMRKLKTGI